jgi:hypothetical protein
MNADTTAEPVGTSKHLLPILKEALSNEVRITGIEQGYGLLQHHLAMPIHAVHTEYVLGQVDSHGSNIHDGLFSSFD